MRNLERLGWTFFGAACFAPLVVIAGGMMEQTIHQLATQETKPWYVEYFFVFLAIVVAPLVGIRFTRWFKHTLRRLRRGKKCHWLILDVFNFTTTTLASSACWWVKYPIVTQAILIGVFVAVLQVLIIKAVAFFAGRFSSELKEEILEGIEEDDEPKTIMDYTKMAAFGRRTTE